MTDRLYGLEIGADIRIRFYYSVVTRYRNVNIEW